MGGVWDIHPFETKIPKCSPRISPPIHTKRILKIIPCTYVEHKHDQCFTTRKTQAHQRCSLQNLKAKHSPNSSATRLATDMAATRLGCVHPMIPLLVKPISAMYCVICVVFPEPVSPITTNTRCLCKTHVHKYTTLA